MRNWRNVVVKPTASIMEVVQIIDAGALQVALVTDEVGGLIGMVTDGDIRRALLHKISFEEPITKIMQTRPHTVGPHTTQQEILALMQAKSLDHMPVVDGAGKLLDMKTLSDLFIPAEYDNWVVLMAGGLGERLRPLTNDCPKPLLKVDGKPILEIIIERFIASGFKKFFISINYKGELIEDYFGDGQRWGAQIKYLKENHRLGTAGALSLLPTGIKGSLIVMNCDLLTTVDFKNVLDFHRVHAAQATMCVREYDFQVPYGVVKTESYKITKIEEKPVEKIFVNAGVYVLEPEVLSHIPSDAYYDMPSLFQKLIDLKQMVTAFPLREYWLDIGRHADFERANSEYPKQN